MSLKNKYERVITRNNMSLGLSSCSYEYLLNLEKENDYWEQTHAYDLKMIDRIKGKSVELFKENKQLKEQLLEQTKNNYKLQDELHKKAKEYQETYKDVREEIKGYKNQLKQRDEVIDEAIKYLMNHYVVDEPIKFKNDLLDILKKYEGDSNE